MHACGAECVCMAAFVPHLIAAVDSIRLTACQIVIRKIYYSRLRADAFRKFSSGMAILVVFHLPIISEMYSTRTVAAFSTALRYFTLLLIAPSATPTTSEITNAPNRRPKKAKSGNNTYDRINDLHANTSIKNATNFTCIYTHMRSPHFTLV